MATAGAASDSGGAANEGWWSCNRPLQVLQGSNTGWMGIFSDHGVVGGVALRRRETPRACGGADAAMEVLVLVVRMTGTSSQGSEIEAGGTDFADGGVGAGGVREGGAAGTGGVREDGAARSPSWGVFCVWGMP
jgi:hypothetical protein